MQSPSSPQRVNPFDRDNYEEEEDMITSLHEPPVHPAQEAEEETMIHEDSNSTILKDDLIDNLSICDEEVIDKLTYGTLAAFLPQLQKAKSSLGDLTENQRILIETVQQENCKFDECQVRKQVSDVMKKAVVYQDKLIEIKKEMLTLHEKSSKLKKRALKIQQQKQKEELLREQDRERELERERMLVAKRAK